jgi:hypothetical protein
MYSAFAFNGTANNYPNTSSFITASGGTITTSGSYRIHTFTSSGEFTLTSVSSDPSDNSIEFLLVGGGGAGGVGSANGNGNGGGAGGFLTGSFTVSTSSFVNNPVQVGLGGLANFVITGSPDPYVTIPYKGQDSKIFTLIAFGGGAAINGYSVSLPNYPGGTDGGSGAGGNFPNEGDGVVGQGNNGAQGCLDGNCGGGGAGQVGQCGAARQGGNGGSGSLSSISGTSIYYAGGGGGGVMDGILSGSVGLGGVGGGGNGGTYNGVAADVSGQNATANTGGGGGGVGDLRTVITGEYVCKPGNGGSGIIILKYKFQ